MNRLLLILMALCLTGLIMCKSEDEKAMNELSYRDSSAGQVQSITTYKVAKGFAIVKSHQIGDYTEEFLDIELYNKDIDFDYKLCASLNQTDVDADLITLEVHPNGSEYEGVFGDDQGNEKWFRAYMIHNIADPDGGLYSLTIEKVDTSRDGNLEAGGEIQGEINIDLKDGTHLQGPFLAEICIPDYED